MLVKRLHKSEPSLAEARVEATRYWIAGVLNSCGSSAGRCRIRGTHHRTMKNVIKNGGCILEAKAPENRGANRHTIPQPWNPTLAG